MRTWHRFVPETTILYDDGMDSIVGWLEHIGGGIVQAYADDVWVSPFASVHHAKKAVERILEAQSGMNDSGGKDA